MIFFGRTEMLSKLIPCLKHNPSLEGDLLLSLSLTFLSVHSSTVRTWPVAGFPKKSFECWKHIVFDVTHMEMDHRETGTTRYEFFWISTI
jgi:hypothetical protein